MRSFSERLNQLLAVAPIVLALVFHAVAMQRWLMAIPAFIGLLIGLGRSVPVSTTSRHWYVSIAVGVLIGLAFPATDVSTGPLPPAAAAALTGVAAMLAVMAVFSNHITVVWAAAWGMVAISGKIEWSGPWRWILLAFFVSSFVAIVDRARLLNQDRRVLLPIGLFVCLLSVSTFGVAAVLHRVDDAFLKSVESIVSANSPTASTGLGSSISLASSSTITPSQRPVLELSEMCGLLRVKVMDQFDGQRWTSSSAMHKPLKGHGDHRLSGALAEGSVVANVAGSVVANVADSVVANVADSVAGSVENLEMFFLRSLDHSLPSPAGVLRFRGVQPKIFGGWIFRGVPDGVSVSMEIDGSMGLPREVYSAGDLLDIPDDLRNGMSEMTENVIEGAKTNVDKAQAIEKFFHENFEYSFSTDLSGEEHPLVVLVQQRRPAFCVYFASAMAVMLRTQDVPCRIVTGYVPGEVNPVSKRVTVRDRDAHAWVEVWDPLAQHFVAFDPTPYTSRSQAMGHDQTPNLASAAFAAARSSVQRWWRMVQIDPLMAAKVLARMPVFWCILALAAIYYWIRKRRISALIDQASVSMIDERMQQLYQKYQRVLANAGVETHPWETDDEVLGRLVESGNTDLAAAANEFVQRYRSARFGGSDFDQGLMEMPIFALPIGAMDSTKSMVSGK